MQHQNKQIKYATDLTDKQRQIIDPLIPPAKPRGRERKIDIREVINAIFYLLKSVIRVIPRSEDKLGKIDTKF